jgi:hypothetical protein
MSSPSTLSLARNGWPVPSTVGEAGSMTSSDLWDAEAAERYDETSAHMFAPDVLDPAVCGAG